MHRADQIVDAVVSALEASADITAPIYAHRTLSLSEDDGELPAISVTYGEDGAAGGEQVSRLLYSTLSLEITAHAVGDDEESVRRELLQMRSQIHVALMADTRFGLTFVHHTFYDGASAPRLSRGERMLGDLTSTWRVRYELNFASPE
jgi:hypothetical protein